MGKALQRILVISPGYIPGFKAGGQLRATVNQVDWLGEEFDFRILTRDRDLGDATPFRDVEVGVWQRVGSANVCYLPLGPAQLWRWLHMVFQLDYDILYLNSFFFYINLFALLMFCFGLVRGKPVIVAPHGEFSPGALGIKSTKKRLTIQLIKWLHIPQRVIWQVTSSEEQAAIENVFGKKLIDSHSHYAPYLPPRLPETWETNQQLSKIPGKLNAVFISRISPKKNLDYALKLLQDVKGKVCFDIYGPQEDIEYWRNCEALMTQVAPTVSVAYKGVVKHGKVVEILSNYHVMLFPTWGENFGFIIYEALAAGLPVIVSDRTPWQDLHDEQAGWVLPLNKPHRFVEAIDFFTAMDAQTLSTWSKNANRVAQQFSANFETLDQNRLLFRQ